VGVEVKGKTLGVIGFGRGTNTLPYTTSVIISDTDQLVLPLPDWQSDSG